MSVTVFCIFSRLHLSHSFSLDHPNRLGPLDIEHRVMKQRVVTKITKNIEDLKTSKKVCVRAYLDLFGLLTRFLVLS